MFTRPNSTDPVDRLAHYLSELLNDNAPLGWERYRGAAASMLHKVPMLKEEVMGGGFAP